MQKIKIGRPQKIPQSFYEYNFAAEAKRALSAEIKMKLLALNQLQSGAYYHDVTKMFQVHKLSVKNWMKRFLDNGLEGLKNKSGRGRKSRFPANLYKDFKQAIIDLQATRPGGRINVADITKMAQEKFGIFYSTKGMYKILHRIDMVWISSRSVHPSRNEAAQEAFKKTL